jgi:hypothetical protein
MRPDKFFNISSARIISLLISSNFSIFTVLLYNFKNLINSNIFQGVAHFISFGLQVKMVMGVRFHFQRNIFYYL